MKLRTQYSVPLLIAMGVSLSQTGCSDGASSHAPSPQSAEGLAIPLRPAVRRDSFFTREGKQRHQSKDRARFAVAGAPRNYDVSSYRLRGSFDWDAATLDASVTISLRLEDPNTAYLEFDSRVDVKSVTVDQKPASFRVDAAQGLLTVTLPVSGTRSLRPLHVTIAYRAPLSSGFQLSSGRDGDPIGSRVLSTDSEPARGSKWMPGNHRPSDRARFAVEMEMAASEDLIANGRRLPDETTAPGRKRVRYESDFDLPTYVMAFAMGDLVHVDSIEPGETPLSVWHRQGIEVNADALLAETRTAMRVYERLLGPYPYSTYSQVLIPAADYSGEENVSITFLLEQAAQTSVVFDYVAHELGHQWFGDLVTVDTWDDLWIKEGMATLLAAEANRAAEDRVGNRLFGDLFSFLPGDAIRDTSLGSAEDGLDRYTSGPYERAAWLLTQIRALDGDDAFWRAARTVLRTRRFGSIGSDDFVDVLMRGKDPRLVSKVKASLDAKGAPVLSVVSKMPTPSFTWSIDDPSGTLIAPIELTTVDRNGVAAVQKLSADTPIETNIDEGGYLAIDERDVHPLPFDVFGLDPSALVGPNAPPLLATRGAAREAFERRSAAVQELAFGSGTRISGPDEFTRLYPLLDSDTGKGFAMIRACEGLSITPPGASRDAWLNALLPVVSRTPRIAAATQFASCGTELPARAFAAELPVLEGDTSPGAAARLQYLLLFDYGPSASFDALSRAAARPGNTSLRQTSLRTMAYHADPTIPYSPIPTAEYPQWTAFFESAMEKSTSGPWLWWAFNGACSLSAESTLPVLAEKLKTIPIDSGHQRAFVCLAYGLSAHHPGAWATFQADMQPWTAFDPSVQDVLSDPTRCQ